MSSNFLGPSGIPQIGDTAIWNGTVWIASRPETLIPLTQQEWGIAPLSGSDNAKGTPDDPLLTGAEFVRRTYGKSLLPGITTVEILEPFPSPEDDFILINSVQTNGNTFLHIRGAEPIPYATGIITARTNAVQNTSLTTIQASIDLAPWVGARIRILSSATAPAGTIATILSVTGGTATLSQPYFQDTNIPGYWANLTLRNLSIGDTFVIERPITCCPLSVTVTGISNNIFFGTCGISNLNLSANTGEEIITAPFLGAQLYGCYLPTQVKLFGSLIACTKEGTLQLKGDILLYANTILGSLLCGSGVSMYFSTRNTIWGGRFTIFGGEGRLSINNEPGANSGLSIHQWPAGAAIFMESGAGQSLNIDAALWGSSTIGNTFALDINSGAQVYYTASRKPTITGSLSPADVKVGGVTLDWASVPNVNSANLAGIIAKTN